MTDYEPATILEALRAIGCTDDEIRARAEWLPEAIARYEVTAADDE